MKDELNRPTLPINQFLKFTSLALSFAISIIGIPTFMRWTSYPQFASWIPMQFNTALLSGLLGSAFFLLLLNKFKFSKAFALLIFLFGTATLFEHLFRVNLGIDQLFRTAQSAILRQPGRMAPNSAAIFISTSLAIFLLSQARPKGRTIFIAGLLGTLGAALGLVKIVSNLFGISGSLDPASFLHTAVPTAITASLAGMILVSLCFDKLKRNEKESYRILPFCITLVLLTTSLGLWQVLLNVEAKHSQQLVASKAENMSREIQERLAQTSLAIKRFASRVEYLGFKDKTFLELDASSYLQQVSSLKRIGLIDTRMNVFWSYPHNIQEQVQSFNQAEDPIRQEALDEAKLTGEPSLSGQIELRSGGKGFILPAPLFQKGHLIGYVYASIEAKRIFRDLDDSKNFQISVREEGVEIYSDEKQDATQAELMIATPFNWGRAHFEIIIIPTDQFVNQSRSPVPYIIFFGGGLLSILLGTFFQSISLARRTELKYVENEKLLTRRLNIALKSAQIGVWSLEIANGEIWRSRNHDEIFGYPQRLDCWNLEVLYSHVIPEDLERVRSNHAASLLKRGLSKSEFRIKRADDNSIRTIKIQSRVILDENNNPKQMIGVLDDITRDVEDRLLLEEALKKAEAGTRAKSAFLATMSHEIRTPLNGIIGMTDLVLDTNLDLHQKKYVEIIQQSGANLLALINDVLDFSKIEANKLELESTHFSVSQILETQADVLAVRAKQQAISLMTFVSPDLPQSLIGDASRVGQVLVNLIGNAVKFTKFGGVSVRANESKSKKSVLESMWVRFEVEDTGIGLTPQGKELLFKPFSQVEGGAKRQFGGTGLGLSISKRLVEAMGGEIGVDCEDRTGSLFWFEIPFVIPTNPNFAKLNVSIEEINKARILVADDDQIVQDTLVRYSRSLGFHTEVSSLAQSLETLNGAIKKNNPFHVAMIGHGAKSSQGILHGKEIKNSLGPLAPKLVLVADFGKNFSPVEIEEFGFEEVLTKPVKQSSLFDALANALLADHKINPTAKISMTSATEEKSDVQLQILVADDIEVNQMLTERLLESLDYGVHISSNGIEVLEAVNQFNFDLILMDCQMPELDGFEATKAIREFEKTTGKRIPIIALTANAMDGDSKRCLDAGMDDYLSKPIRKEKLNAMLTKWLKHRDRKLTRTA